MSSINLSRFFTHSELIPVIAQDADSGAVLMLAYTNEEALGLTITTGTAWFWSRSRRELWNKGATSGNYLHVRQVFADCDNDTILLKVRPDGPACHTGETSCFYTELTLPPRD
ncbi:MAG: phosphoribosyl-AMP cyclohydrolase [Oscillospiraceae bacterium]|jgi:phosphoribosyl-AMP cyclohydrolase|nr:phosphoribosyl-AMP cyclohydrolase [Oscillospiraceae bacterium]